MYRLLHLWVLDSSTMTGKSNINHYIIQMLYTNTSCWYVYETSMVVVKLSVIAEIVKLVFVSFISKFSNQIK